MNKDRYLHFTYNGTHSSQLGVFYINKGEDISLPFTSKAARRFASPMYQNISYNLGKTEESRSHSLQLAADGRNLNDVQDIMEWLDPGSFGELIFDFRPDYAYKVFINKINSPVIIPHEFPNNVIKHVVMFDVEFVTHGDHFVETRESYIIDDISLGQVKNLYEPDELLPIYRRTNDNKNLFINWSNVNQFININHIGSSIELKKVKNNTSTTHYKYKNLGISDVLEIKTDLGVALKGNQLVEKVNPNALETNLGPMPIEPGLIYSGNANITRSGSTLKIKTNSRFKFFNSTDKFFVYVEKEIGDNEVLEPNKDPLFWFKGYYVQNKVGNNYTLKIPVVKEATYNSDNKEFSFSNTDLNLETGEYKVKIAKATELQFTVVGSKTTIEIKYKKGV